MERILAAVCAALQALPESGAPRIVALDGRCAAGKPRWRRACSSRPGATWCIWMTFSCAPPSGPRRVCGSPGGNVDRERFLAEVLRPLPARGGLHLPPVRLPHTGLEAAGRLDPAPLTIVEGAYSCHPDLWDLYDLHLFLTVSPDEQLRRIRARNGADGLEMFQNRWIPLEEAYFQAFSIEKRCEYRFRADQAE